MKNETHLILHNIRSVYNVGAIFRTADCAGITKIYLTGYTPVPLDRFGLPRADLAKSALGAEKTVPWEHHKNHSNILKNIRMTGFYIIALEQSKNSVDYKKVKVKQKTAIIVGNEVRGLPQSILKYADTIAEIPLKGKKESLNVSVATGIFLFRILDI